MTDAPGERWIAGADVGGSLIRIAVAQGDREVARCEAARAAPNLSPRTATLLANEIATVLRQALMEAGTDTVDHLVAGVAGAGREPERLALQEELEEWNVAHAVRVTTDLEIALVAAFGLHHPGMLLVAGTGSAGVARLDGGRLERVGGLGWRMGDEGGGYAIGCAALRAVGRAMDGRGPATLLSQQIARSLDLDDESLVRWAGHARVRDVAALAPIVVRAADRDPVAGAIVAQAAGDLATVVRALVSRAAAAGGGGGSGLALALTGGLLHDETALRRGLTDQLSRDVPGLRILGIVDPLAGALRLAGEKMQ